MQLDIAALCGREIHCACGRVHYCPISQVIVEKDALAHLPELTRTYRHILVAADTHTAPLCAARVESLLGDKLEGALIFEREGVLVPDERAIAELESRLTSDTDLILGIGSGVINDICKYVAFHRNLDYGILCTAPSMDGYASSGAAMILHGMKVTETTRPPKYIIADVDIVKNAPIDMIRSGYGDIIGKYSSLNDWKLSHLIHDEYLCPEVYALVMDVTDHIRDLAEQIISRDDEAIAALTKALILIGVTLSLLDTTRPGSGSEHHLSHFFEIVGLVHHRPHFTHGIDVAYSTVVTAGMRERIVRMETPQFCTESAAQREKAWENVFGPIAPEVRELQREGGFYTRDYPAVYAQKWDAIRDILRECPTAQECRDMLLRAGYDPDAFERRYGKDGVENAMRYGKDLKIRYSVLWLYYTLFSGEEA